MARSNFLDRFRPVGSPGPAARSGVPAMDAVGPDAELGVVFGALAPELEQAEALVNDAQRESEQVLAVARTAADDVLSHARLESPAARRRSYEAVLAAAAQEDSRLEEQASAEAAELERSGQDRIPATVQRLIERIFRSAATT
ncbi:hypothetical protein [Sinomonas humi]|uniref:Uncharacterized protein n=1 Tax=Sinomonas humi TaxID=1338436 RepID=A0A0B2AKP0_9MICC|nr:hypothetical protein [Sinomonas humi]KHL04220.1 hypothetical protein LK10_06670 [Sinomonas humi]